MTYKKSGVDIEAANRFVDAIKPLTKGIGGFGGLFKFDTKKYKDPYLVSSTDGVGTKLKIAFLAGKHDTIGIDLVGMNVNDVLCTGAKPLFFLDYIATGKIEKKVLVDVIKGIVEGCRQAGCALVGGETAEMPGFYKAGEYDVAGFCVGAVDKSKAIDGSKIKAGDVLIGIESNGLHSNGFSLVRKVFSRKELLQYADELLKPTRIYVKPMLTLLRETRDERRRTIKGIAHITGGAFYDKIPRIIPKGLAIRIQKKSWPLPEIFRIIQRKGNVPEQDMYRTLNMGIGMVLAADKAASADIISYLAKQNLKSWIIGEVVKGSQRVAIV
ncbi:MAG: phosphoribosylformylglycinamidine cyclo-ligase [Omnitrophica WOR_2 bacterium GWF2_43_52]|nr:MAG: phosphoribosylformylglycinamidine cyclo-ligase [Omnitrophica WOR_2 bacterium GWC2_44_8]OGX22769.1 MAG: phosphoribosylformylglycinamidine cyclo-ligase [Omnitrophica WOR_2 bacterium GWF2_43_52]OGX54372.1 MAG: phosphoribosylformylglycinamidine cyclo-ligase [Omnitrophica WOR_2 bacterium RIFOXYC2_FULL_43_9]HAH20249.1 phosphoribosylformylglycinamidine cyclo-ligase [Candidatus Omnitrophota bacterium]HBG63347.1 phosphoribosylformylglycinamidine cyclo-ligase [Candidatus Omnitrophota bacterium]